MVYLAFALAFVSAAPGNVKPSTELDTAKPELLGEASKLVEQQRYEEAVVEFQRYLTDTTRPAAERARALFELGFVHVVLGDDANADARALEALTLNPTLSVAANAPPRQLAFLKKSKEAFAARPQMTLEKPPADAPAHAVHLSLKDPKQRVQRVLLRHAPSPQGPYRSTQMQCSETDCSALIPSTESKELATSYYFVEALDAQQRTLTQLNSERDPMQVVVVEPKSWYKSPVVYGVAGTAVVAIATLVYFLVPPPPPSPK
jgi:hypothetical protein